MPFLLIIPLMVWTLTGGQTRLRLWRHGQQCKALSRSFQARLLRFTFSRPDFVQVIEKYTFYEAMPIIMTKTSA
jgi:hypothetical protein